MIITNVEWNLVKVQAEKKLRYYQCCKEPYPIALYTVTLKRNPSLYKAIVVTPIFGECKSNEIILNDRQFSCSHSFSDATDLLDATPFRREGPFEWLCSYNKRGFSFVPGTKNSCHRFQRAVHRYFPENRRTNSLLFAFQCFSTAPVCTLFVFPF